MSYLLIRERSCPRRRTRKHASSFSAGMQRMLVDTPRRPSQSSGVILVGIVLRLGLAFQACCSTSPNTPSADGTSRNARTICRPSCAGSRSALTSTGYAAHGRPCPLSAHNQARSPFSARTTPPVALEVRFGIPSGSVFRLSSSLQCPS